MFLYSMLPVSYTFSSRIMTSHERVSWCLIYPIFLLFTFLVYGDVNLVNIVCFVLTVVATVALYETGYLYNDFITVKNEKKPTIRENRHFKKSNLKKYFVSRVSVVALVIYLIPLFLEDSYIVLLVSSLVLATAFYLHNTVRSVLNVITYFLVSSSKYVVPLILFVDLDVLIAVILAFPLIRTLEHSTKIKYNLIWVQKRIENFDVFRVYYYVFFLVLFLYLKVRVDSNLFLIFLYFFIIRISILITMQFIKVKRNRHSGYRN